MASNALGRKWPLGSFMDGASHNVKPRVSGFRTSFTPATVNRPADVSGHRSHPHSDGRTPLSRILRLSNSF